MTLAKVRLGAIVGAVAALFLVAGATAAADTGVSIAGFAFNPGTITVHVGDTVTWTNNDATSHTATGSGFDTGTISSGSSATVTFATAGTFAYHCSIHSSMTGTVVVEAAANGGGQATTPPTDTAPVTHTANSGGPGGAGGPGALALLVLAGVLGAGALTRRLARRRGD